MRRTQWFLASLALSFSVSGLFFSWDVCAEGTQFSASVERNEVGLDESVGLVLTIRTDKRLRSGEPKYQATDFELINQYQQQSSQISLINGSFESNTSYVFKKILRPKKTGSLRISNIHVDIDGKDYKAPDIVVSVRDAGAGGASNTGKLGAAGGGLRGGNYANKPAFLRAEVDQGRPYKGQMISVSYYLYLKTRYLGGVVITHPKLGGLIKEDPEVPIMQNNLQWERVVSEGQVYFRALVARYKGYPLNSGKLVVDPMQIRVQYLANQQGEDDMEDFGFFGSMAQPRESLVSNPTLNVEVQSLPEDGKPAGYTGAVGDFQATSQLDKNAVSVNQPVTLTVEVQGRGNLAAIGQPQIKFPPGIEVFESKGKVNATSAGVGSKIFEIVLIPRTGGKFEIPVVEFGFFSPTEKKYSLSKTKALSLDVSGANAASQGTSVPNAISGNVNSGAPVASVPTSGVARQLDLAERSAESFEGKSGLPFWDRAQRGGAYFLAAVSVLLLAAASVVGFLNFRQRKRKGIKDPLKKTQAQILSAEWKKYEHSLHQGDFVHCVQSLKQILFITLETKLQVQGLSSMTLDEFEQTTSKEARQCLDRLNEFAYSPGTSEEKRKTLSQYVGAEFKEMLSSPKKQVG